MGKQYLNGVLYGTGEIIKFSPYIYSLEEREVGVWTDGKPLYQKSITIPISSQTGDITYTVDSGLSVVNAFGIIKTTGGFEMVLPASYSNIFYCGLQHDSNYIRLSIYSSSSWQQYNTLTEATVTYQYTKTTDTPGSGKYTTEGGQAVHYSQTEQIIGTWIDGKTLYEKVYRINDRGSNIPANLLSDLNIVMIIDCSIMLYENNNCTRQDLTYNVQTKLLSGIPSNQWIDHIIVRYIKSS